MTAPHPTRFGYRTPFAWLQVTAGVVFPLTAVGLVIGGLVAWIDGVPFNAGTVAFGAAWSLAAGGFGLWSLFGLGYEVGVEGKTFTWRAPLARATFDLTEAPLDVFEAANGFGSFRTLRFGSGTEAVTRTVYAPLGFGAFIDQVRRVQES